MSEEFDKADVSGVICYWQYTPPNRKSIFPELWELAESFPIDDDGYPLIKTSTDDYGSRRTWEGWMNKREEAADDEDYPDFIPIMGRAVTMWSFENGARLLDFHPPEFVPWLSIRFVEELKKSKRWADMLEDGTRLYLATIEAAKKYVFVNY